MNEVREEILRNLSGRIYPVGAPCALSGVDVGDGLAELRKLQREGIVRVEPLTRDRNSPQMYRLSMGYVNRRFVTS